MLPIIWNQSALDDLAEIVGYIAESNPLAARKLQTRIKASIKPAAANPHIGREGSVADTREVVATANYIIVYQALVKTIEVTSIYHASQQYPKAAG